MSFPEYSQYKESMVGWLGAVPARWDVKPLKFLASFTNGAAFKPDSWAELGTPIIRIQNLNGGEKFNHFAGDVDARYHVASGDLLFGWSGNRGTSFGPFRWSRHGLYYLNQHIFKVSASGCDRGWLYWCLKAVTSVVENEAHGIIGMVHVTAGKLGGINAPYPDPKEQVQITAFLDRETAKIDELITEQELLVGLLEEKRQAVISHAVTKGLDPSAPMKDSGVEWVGMIPARWSVKRLRKVGYVQTGVAKGRNLDAVDTIRVPYLRVANVQSGFVDVSDVSLIDIGRHELDRYLLQKGDVLMNEGGDFDKLGRGQVWSGEINPCVHQNHVFAVRPTEVEPEWLALITASEYGQHFFKMRANQSTNLASISSSNLRELPVMCPPEDERRDIMRKVADEVSQLVELSTLAKASIALLRERRAALISAAVTGKIDVRGLIAHASPMREAAE